MSSDVRQGQVKELSHQFRGALIGYDEGWLTNDMVLANMVWRRVFNQECNDPEKVELVVKYIRKQVMSIQMYIFTRMVTEFINIIFYLFSTDVHSTFTIFRKSIYKQRCQVDKICIVESNKYCE